MTSYYKQKIHCPNCGVEITAETSFSRWIRNRKDLDSLEIGLSVMDMDYVIHRFRREKDRTFQCIMIVEVKTRGAEMTDSQRDTAYTLGQIMRNRRHTPSKNLLHQSGNGLSQVHSAYIKQMVWLRNYGVHVLTFQGLGPDDSAWIKWDKQEIDTEQLAALLRFDLDPDTLSPMDWRSHHKKNGHTEGATLFAEI